MAWLRRTGARTDGKPPQEAPPALADFFANAKASEPRTDAVPVLTPEATGPVQFASDPRTVAASGQAPVASASAGTPPAGAPAATPAATPPTPPADRPAPDVAIEVRWDVVSAPGSVEPVVHALVTLTPKGSALVHPAAGPVAHVILALDVSASMCRPDKYPVLQKSLESMLRDLQVQGSAEVRFTVIAFGRGAEFVRRDDSSRRLAPQTLLDAVQGSSLLFTNYTDVAGALQLAAQAAHASHLADRRLPIRVIVLTDGRPQDVRSADEQVRLLRKLPADLDCLCFGDDADVETMKRLVCGGRGGTVKHVSSDTIEDAFGRIAEVAQRVVAKRALVDVELRGDVLGGRAFRFRPGRHDFGVTAFEDGTSFTTDLGTLESGRAYSLLFRLRLPSTDQSETEVGRVSVRLPWEGGPRTFESILAMPRHAGSQDFPADPIVRQALEILGAGEASDPQAQLRSLLARRALHVAERRDSRSIAVIDRAISLLQGGRSLDELSYAERAVLTAHTRTVHAASRRTPAGKAG